MRAEDLPDLFICDSYAVLLAGKSPNFKVGGQIWMKLTVQPNKGSGPCEQYLPKMDARCALSILSCLPFPLKQIGQPLLSSPVLLTSSFFNSYNGKWPSARLFG
jgi:hypothetical protein